MSELALSTPESIFSPWTPAVGEDQKALANLFHRAKEDQKNVQDWNSYIELGIAEISAECSVDDWDGQGAAAVLQSTLDISRNVANLLHESIPLGLPPPDVIPEADGEVALSWTRTPDRAFSISVGNHGYLNYAGTLAKGVAIHDVARFSAGDKTTIQQLAAFLKQLYR
jgi:hypothetical protein